MRTTLDIPKELIEEVMKITNAKSKSDAVKIALQEILLREERLKLLKYKGKVDLNIDLKTLRQRSR